MNGSDQKKEPNRRRSRRLGTKRTLRVYCRNALDLGANLALALLDLSETGVRLKTSTLLNVGSEVTITLESPVLVKPVTRKGKVVWSVERESEFSAGVEFEKNVPYASFSTIVGI